MRLENLEKAQELSSLHERLSTQLNALTEYRDDKLQRVEFIFGGKMIDVSISHPHLLQKLKELAIAYISEQREQLVQQIEEL